MEEHVGELWGHIITRLADRSHHEAAVRFADIEKLAGLLFRGFGGDPALKVRETTATAHGARRRWLARIAGSQDHVELAWVDQDSLYLPSCIACFPSRELNHDLYVWLIAMAANDPLDGTPWLQRNQAIARRVLERLPGMAGRYQRLVDAHIAQRLQPRAVRQAEAEQERLLRQALHVPGSVATLPAARRAHQPVLLWLHPAPPISTIGAGAQAPEGEPAAPQGNASKSRDTRRRRAERTDMPEDKNTFLMLFRPESIFSFGEYTKVNRATDEDEPDNAQQIADDMDVISVARDDKPSASRLRFDLDLPSAEEDDTPLAEGVLLPEWHYRRRQLLENHCRVQPLMATQAPPCALPVHLRPSANRLRRQFQALLPQRQVRRAQPQGLDIDLDACVRNACDRRNGQLRSDPALYMDIRAQSRDLACLLLADLSLSTDAYVNDDSRVIDVIRDSLYLFGEALSATRDRFGIYGFSSVRRGNVRYHVIKDFAQPYDAMVRGRIQAIKPGFYTRMGAAIRHSTNLLQKQQAAEKLLLILTDGKPNDLDVYEGRYGVEDTRMAVREAKRAGLRPFCVTIDEKAEEYLPHLFGAGNYVVIRNVAELPRKLPQLYAQIVG